MFCKQNIGNPGTFMVAGNDKNRYSPISYREERFKGLCNMDCRNSTAVKEVAPVYDHIHIVGWFKSPPEILVEVDASSTSFYSRIEGKVKAKVRVSEEQYFYYWNYSEFSK
jgi:hypothetical protein